MEPPCAAPGVDAAAPLDQLRTVGGRGVVTTAWVRGGAAAAVGPFVRPTAGPLCSSRVAPGSAATVPGMDRRGLLLAVGAT